MDKLDRELRKYLLKPLGRSPRGDVDRKTLLNALSKLEERALGEHLLGELRAYLKSTRKSKSKNSWKDPEEARKAVAIAKVLYASRRISTQEYIFYAVSPVGSIHDARLMDGAYKSELRLTNKKMRELEERHGLAADEYWPPGEGPKAYNRLNRQWEDIVESEFVEVLREFGLDDLADLKVEDSERFDRFRERGRRAVFHRNEQVPAIRDVVVRHEDDAHSAASVNAYSAAVTSLGAAIEGLLVLRCLKSPKKAGRVAAQLKTRIQPPNRLRDDPTAWRFETLIEVCFKAGWLPRLETDTAVFDAAGLAHLLRHLRNLIHPGRHVRERPWSEIDQRDYNDAEAIYTVLRKTLE